PRRAAPLLLWWARRHTAILSLFAAGLVAALAVAATLLIRQDVTVNPASKASDVVFQTGTDYTTINAQGFATLTLGSSGASATLALSGVPGAALTTLGNVVKLTDTSATKQYNV